MNVEALLSEVSPEAPCGENLEADPEYFALTEEAKGVPEVEIGNTVVAAQEPDWRGVRDHSVKLLARTKDLAVGLHLSEALIKLEGLPGFRDGLVLINGLLERYWDTLHPQPDLTDDEDPHLRRVNILGGLTDSGLFLSKLRAVPLTNSVSAGRFGLRDIAWATGRIPAPENVVPPKPEMIEAAFKDTAPEELQATGEAVDTAIERVKAIDAILAQNVGAGRGVEFEPLVRVLNEIRTELRKYSPATATAGDGGDAVAEAIGRDGSRGGTGSNGRPSVSGEIRSPEDVVAAIDRICDYYARLEPSSPVPLLLRRAQRLVGKGFLDIVRDLSPEVVRQIEALGGITADGG